ncbi:Cdc6-like AAA superfamily ATPase [Bradyrhizobium sp. S3.2.6]|uniref:hypothetical protein n=1 Tax=Bradyrhizobium sp. S3.2.6 TaxID=3156428 RepID=UPI00339638E4
MAKEKTALSLLRHEVFRFLKDPKPEVICIRGKWGAGKTYTWEELLKQAGKDVALQSYSYVSLFGMDTLDRLKSSIFENVIPVKSIDDGPTVETLGENFKALSKLALAAIKPGAGAIAEHAAFLSVRNYIVCIDDLERKGEKLRIIDILGLASLLKERRKCKIVLILNDDALDKEKADFEKYSEKVIDSSLVFEPTSVEAAQIAFKGTEESDKLMRENCRKLEIANIRILKKIERLVNDAKRHLAPFDDRVLTQAVSTLVLLGWCVYAKQDDLFQYTLNERYKSRYSMNNKLSDDQKKLDDLLEAYPFGLVDAFDRVLLEGIQKGFVDNTKLVEEAQKLDDGYKNKKMRDAVQGPWDLYRDSFDDNVESVCDGLINAMKEYPDYTPINYVDGAIMFLKRVGKAVEAQKILEDWLEAMKDEPRGFYDVQSAGFAVQDPDLRASITHRYNSFVDSRDPADVLFEIAKNHAWSQEDIALISEVTADEFYTMFKRLRGLELRSVIKKTLEIGRHGGGLEYKAIGENALAALTRLRGESPINDQRVKGLYQIT